ncbi:MAG TPA: hypothetical protein VK961_25200 [Chthoniobacter sp.]|nr:hypothetical protein [Chthoniobacter sp.]
MKAFRLLFAAMVAMFGLTGCLQMEQVVKLKPDGSGTVEETVVLSKAGLAATEQMVGTIGGATGKKKEGASAMPDLFDEAKIKAAASKMGEGVTFVSAERIDGEQGKGFKAIYAFTDINKLKLDQNPGEALSDSGGPKPPGNKKEPILFQFDKGSPAQLSLKMPAPEFKPKEPQPEGMEDMAMQMMKQMFKDMRISLAVEVQGMISETNAEYRDGSRVTLMDMDFNKVMADPEKFKALAKANPQSLQEAKALIKGLDGVKIESAPEVKIKFQ